MPDPFMEHPTGDFDTSVDAMEDAVRRLRALPNWSQWIAFGAQGEGGGPDSHTARLARKSADPLGMEGVEFRACGG